MTVVLVPPHEEMRDDGSGSTVVQPPLAALFAPYFAGLSIELCVAAGFDSRGCLRAFFGAVGGPNSNHALIPCVRAALRPSDVDGIIIAHNHPDGDALLSISDIDTTRRVAALCRLAGAFLADHLLFAGDHIVSFKGRGII